MTTIAAKVATWTRGELQCLVAELAAAAGDVPPRVLAAARLRAAEAAVDEAEKLMSEALDDYIRSTTLERAAIAMRAPNATVLREQSADAAARWERCRKRADAARSEARRRRMEWERLR